MLSRPMRVPSAAIHLHESPCLPPTDWMMKWRALAGGGASSDAGTCARSAEETISASHNNAILLCMLTFRLSVSAVQLGSRVGARSVKQVADRGAEAWRESRAIWSRGPDRRDQPPVHLTQIVVRHRRNPVMQRVIAET